MGYIRVQNSKTGKVYDSRGPTSYHRPHSMGGDVDSEGSAELEPRYCLPDDFDYDQFLEVLYGGDQERIAAEKAKNFFKEFK